MTTALKQKILLFLIYAAPFFFLVQPWFRYLMFVIGVLLGLVLLILDEQKFYSFYNEEEDLTRAKENNTPVFLVTRSSLFLLALIPLSIFVTTSTGSALGSGLMMGLMLGLLIELWQFSGLPTAFNQRFISQIRKTLDFKQIRQLVWGATAFFIVINLLTIL